MMHSTPFKCIAGFDDYLPEHLYVHVRQIDGSYYALSLHREHHDAKVVVSRSDTANHECLMSCNDSLTTCCIAGV